MMELKLMVSEIDYEAVVRLFAGSLGPTAAAAARMMPESAKEELAVKYLNASAGKLSEKAESMAAEKGIRVKISGAQAKVVK